MAATKITLLQKYAEEIADEITPDEQADKVGFDPITIIIAIITALLGNCPKPTAKMVREPNRLQQAALLKETRNACACCNGGNRIAGDIYRGMLKKGKSLKEDEAAALVVEAQDLGNLLV